MNRTQTPAGTRDAIRERIGRELAGGEPTGLRPDRDAGRRHRHQPCLDRRHRRAAVVTADRPDQGAARPRAA